MPEVGSVPESWADDDQLFAALKEAMRAARAVPPEFVEAGKSAYAWRNIDAELASLTYDSTRDLVPSVRSETAGDKEKRKDAFTQRNPVSDRIWIARARKPDPKSKREKKKRDQISESVQPRSLL